MIQETIRTPTWFALFWVEASADPTAGGSVAIAGAPPKILATLNPATPLPRGAPAGAQSASPLPAGTTMVANSRGLIFQTLPIQYAGAPSEEQLQTLPVPTPQLPSGQSVISIGLVSVDGRYHPRIVNVKPPTSLAPGGTTAPSPIYVLLRPSLQGTRISESGALILNMQWSTSTASAPLPARWAVVTLTCTRPGVTYGFTGQADVNGDVIVSLTGLPPLPQPTSPPDAMTLSVQADISQAKLSQADAAQGCDTDALVAMSPTPVLASGTSTVISTLPISRGKINNATTVGFAAGLTLQAPQGSS